MAQPLYTYDDLLRTPEDNVRREIFAGVLHVSPSGTPSHQRLVVRLLMLLVGYASRHGGEAFVAPLDVVFDDINTAQPDDFYIGPERMHIVGERAIRGAPSLTVEVLSPSNSRHDTVIKAAMYARFGVPEYWIVDPKKRRIEQFWDAWGDRYTKSKVHESGATMLAATLPELACVLDDIFSAR